MAKTHVRCRNCGLKPIDHLNAMCTTPEYRRIPDAIVHPSEMAASVTDIAPHHWKELYA